MESAKRYSADATFVAFLRTFLTSVQIIAAKDHAFNKLLFNVFNGGSLTVFEYLIGLVTFLLSWLLGSQRKIIYTSFYFNFILNSFFAKI